MPFARHYPECVAGHGLRDRTRARIERLCAAAFDPERLCLEVIGQLQRAVGFDAYCWPLTDPASGTAGLAVFDLPLGADMARYIHLHHGVNNVNRHTTLAAGRSRTATLYSATSGDLHRCVHWRESLRPYGIRDELSAAYSDYYGCWAFTEMYRLGRPFTDDDVNFLDDVAPTITTGLREAQARNHTAPPAHEMLDGPAVLIIDDDLNLVSSTPAADAWLGLPHPDTAPAFPLPGRVYGLVGRLDAVRCGLERLPAILRTSDPTGAWVRLRAARLDGGFGDYAVSIEQCSPDERLDILGRTIGLSARQRELLALAAAGLDTRTMARRLILSEHTVQEHFKTIFAKAGVKSRRELLSFAIGAAAVPA